MECTRRFASGCLLALLLLGFPACGSPPPTASPTAARPPSEARPLPAEYRAVLASVAAARGLPVPEDLSLGLVAREQVPALLDALITPADRAEFGRTTTLYRLLGYLGPDDDYEETYLRFAAHAFAAVYDHSRRTIWLVAPPGADPAVAGSADRRTLIHEMVHALQFSSLGVAGTLTSLGGSPDQVLAFAAVLEGDASTLAADLEGATSGSDSQGELGAAPPGIPAPIERALRFPYEAGPGLVRAERSARGNAGVDSLLRSPPSSTASVLHLGETPGSARLEPALPDISSALGSEWKPVSRGTLGEFELRNFLLQRLRALEAATAAATWRGDAYAVYENGRDSTLAFRVATGGSGAVPLLAAALANWAAAGGADVRSTGGYSIAAAGESRWLAWANAGTDVLVTIATSRDTAERALKALSAP
jgi:hypothetical protein